MWSPAAVWGVLVNCWSVVPSWPCPPLHNSIISGGPNGTPTANVAERVVLQGKILAAKIGELSVRARNRLCKFHLVNHGIHLPDRLSTESCWARVYKLNRASPDPHIPLSQVHALWSDRESSAFILPSIFCLEYQPAYMALKPSRWSYRSVRDRTVLAYFKANAPRSQDCCVLTLGMHSLLLCLLLTPSLVLVNEVKKGGVGDVDRKHPAPATHSPLYEALWERPAVHWGATASSRAEWTQMGRVPGPQSKQTFTLAHRHAHIHGSYFTLGVQG